MAPIRDKNVRRIRSSTSNTMAPVSAAVSHARRVLLNHCVSSTSNRRAGAVIETSRKTLNDNRDQLRLQRRRTDGRRGPGSTPGHHDFPVACIAVPTFPPGDIFLAEVVEDEPRPALCALTVVDHRAQLGPILESPLFVVGEVGAQ